MEEVEKAEAEENLRSAEAADRAWREAQRFKFDSDTQSSDEEQRMVE